MKRGGRLRFIRDWVVAHGEYGATSAEVEKELSFDHGVASGALSRLHADGVLARLATKRGRHSVYVAHPFIAGRQTVERKRRTAPITFAVTASIPADAVTRYVHTLRMAPLEEYYEILLALLEDAEVQITPPESHEQGASEPQHAEP